MLIYIISAIVFFMVLFLVSYLIIIYNGLITVTQNIDKAWANIDVLLKQRHDEIPKLITTCESYMQYERGITDQILKARMSCLQANNVAESAQAENMLSQSLKSLFAIAENYPNLKASDNFQKLQERISYLESQIADRREFYNDSVNSYNIRICQIPDVFIANGLQLKSRSFFKIIEEDKTDPAITIKLP